jgi:hypothetical protein
VNVLDSGLGQVNSSDGGIDCPGDCTADVADDTTVTLTATPAAGYVLGVPDPLGGPIDESGWAACSPVQGDPSRCTVQVPAAGATVDVSFRPAALLLVVANGGGGEITATVPNPQVGESGPLVPGERSCVSDPGGGAICPLPYLAGRAVTLTPSPLGGSFPIWSDDGCLDGMACTLVLDELRQSISATFATQHVWVRLHGSGEVHSTPPGLDCLSSDFPPGDVPECSAEFSTGTDVGLTAVGIDPDWEDALPPRAGCDYFSDAAKKVCHVVAERSRWAIATFGGAQADSDYPPKVGVRFRVRRSGSGRVDGTGIACGSDCSVDTSFGERIDLLARASSGHRFVRWRRGCGTRARCRLTAGPVTRVTAMFAVAGVPSRTELKAAMDRVRVRRIGRRRYRIVMPLHINLASAVSARLAKPRRRAVLRRRWQLQAGDSRLAVRVRARRGRYRLSVTVRSTDGQEQVIKRRLRLR